jgi:hypothetical protein
MTLVKPVVTNGASMEPKIIKVSPETHKKLLKLGSKGETFDQIIIKCIDAYLRELDREVGGRKSKIIT